MNAQVALLICSIGVAGLFFLDRDKSVRLSNALWLPVIWLGINGSRPISSWFTAPGPYSGDVLAATLDGNPLDAAIYEILIVLGVIVLARRGKSTGALLKASAPILIYFIYCLMSTAWSPFPGPSFKRWIKCVGDLVMVMVIVTDAHPMEGLRRLFSRVGFLLLPLSVVLIRWTNLGVEYEEDGPHFTGVTTNKNTFGLILYVLSIGIVWNLSELILDKKAPNRTRRLIAQGALLGFNLVLLHLAHSATSIFCSTLGSGLMLASNLPAIRKRPRRVHILSCGILLLGAGGMLFGGSGVASAMGKSSDFSGRTEIWAAALASADSPLIGTGFESFWNKNAHKVRAILYYYNPGDLSNLNSAHDGYLQIYLDIGSIGLCLVLIILIGGYFKAVKAFRRDRKWGGLLLAFIITCAFYNITEAGFRIMTPSWFSLLLAVMGATGINIGLIRGEERKGPASRSRPVRPLPFVDNRFAGRKDIYAAKGPTSRLLQSTVSPVPRVRAL
jgi:O-antigen ligase